MTFETAPSPVPLGVRLPARAVRDRVVSLSPRLCLVATAAISFAVRLAASFAHGTPRYFPDEYIYSSLARSIAESGRLQIRGAHAHFPALLEPLLAAPFWLTHDPALAYRLTLAMHALAMSLAAFPVFWLARRVGAGSWPALACAVLAVSIPDLVYVNFVTADAVAYPLVLGAIAAAVAALERPTTRAQLLFVVLSGLATFARVQYVVLPVIFLIIVLASEGSHVTRALRRYRVTFFLFALPAVALAAAGPARVLGYYRAVFSLSVDPLALGHWVAVDSMLLVYAGGIVLVPGAVLGTLAAFVRPRTRAEGAFARMTVGLACALLAEAALYAGNTNGSERFQERYLFALLPLLPVGFLLSVRRERLRLPIVALSSALLLLALRVPLTGYTNGTGKQDSPVLQAVYWLQDRAGNGSGALVVLGIVSLLTLVAIGTALRPRVGVAASLLLALVVAVLASAAALSYDFEMSGRTALTYLPRDFEFVDHAHQGNVSVLVPPGTPRPLVLRASLLEHLDQARASPSVRGRTGHLRIGVGANRPRRTDPSREASCPGTASDRGAREQPEALRRKARQPRGQLVALAARRRTEGRRDGVGQVPRQLARALLARDRLARCLRLDSRGAPSAALAAADRRADAASAPGGGCPTQRRRQAGTARRPRAPCGLERALDGHDPTAAPELPAGRPARERPIHRADLRENAKASRNSDR